MGNWNSVPEPEVVKPPPSPLLKRPWRKQEFNTSTRNDLLEFIRNYQSLTELVEEPRILLIGQIGAGKSSFFNSVNAVFKGRATFQAMAGHGLVSVSKQYRTYPVEDGRCGKKLPFILCDTMGLEGNSDKEEGIHVDDVISVIRGHVSDLYEFNPKAPITRFDSRYRQEPSLADKVHCVVYVIEANTDCLMTPRLMEKLTAIREKVNDMAIPQLVLLTKIDEACLEIDEDLSKAYWSRYIYEKVKKLGQILGIPVSCIMPVKNYSSETEPVLEVDILVMKALKQMLNATDDYFSDLKLKGEAH